MRKASVAAVVFLAVAACGGSQTRPGVHDSTDEVPSVQLPSPPAPDAGAWDGALPDDGGAPDSGSPDAGGTDAGYAFPTDVEWAYSVTGSFDEGVRELLVHPDGHLLVVGGYDSPEGARMGDAVLPDMTELDPDDRGEQWEDLFIAAYRPDGTRLWVHTYGGRYSIVVATGATLDAHGALYVTGFYRGGPDLGLGPLPYNRAEPGHFLMKLSADGTRTEWVKTSWTNLFVAWHPRLATQGDSVYWAISHTGQLKVGDVSADVGDGRGVALLRFGPDGVQQGDALLLGNTQDSSTAKALAVGPDGSVHLGLWGRGTLRVGGADVALPLATHVVVKLGPDGRYRWHKVLVEDASDDSAARSLALAVDAQGEVFLAGDYNGTLSLAGQAVRPARSAVFDSFVANLGPDAEERWLVATSPEQDVRLEGGGSFRLQVWRDGEVALVGRFSMRLRLCGIDWEESSNDGFHNNAYLAVLGSDGACHYGRTLGQGDSFYYVQSVCLAQGQADGEVYLGGALEGTWPIRVDGDSCHYSDGRTCTRDEDGFFLRLRR